MSQTVFANFPYFTFVFGRSLSRLSRKINYSIGRCWFRKKINTLITSLLLMIYTFVNLPLNWDEPIYI